jgi:hypothetical protein
MLDKVRIAAYSGNLVYFCSPYNRPSPSRRDFRHDANLRTIIVIADIHRGLHNPALHIAMKHPSWLTFRHWSGVTPYTSSYEFAGSCVFGKQLPGKLSLRALLREPGLIANLRPLFCRVP